MRTIQMLPQIITNFLLYKTGLFHKSRKKNSGSTFSSDPDSGGIPTLRPDGTLAYELVDLKVKRGDPKVLFFATDQLFKTEGLTENQKSLSIGSYLRSYLRSFHSYGYDLDGKLAVRSSPFEIPTLNLDMSNERIRADIYEALSHENRIGPVEIQEKISADEVLIIDDALIRTTDALSDSDDQIFKDPEICFLDISPRDSDSEADAKIQACFSKIPEARCAYLKTSRVKDLAQITELLKLCPRLEFLELDLPINQTQPHALSHLPPKVRNQLVTLRIASSYEYSGRIVRIPQDCLPWKAESLGLSKADIALDSFTEMTKRRFNLRDLGAHDLTRCSTLLSPNFHGKLAA